MDLDGPQMMLEREAGSRETESPVAVAFYDGFKADPEATEKMGRPMVKPCVFVMISTPGQNLEIYDQPATKRHIERFPKNYQRYLDGNKPLEEGHTPLHMFPPLSRADVINYRSLGIHSVEALCAVNDDNLSRLGFGSRELQAKAKAWLAAATDGAAAAKLAADNQRKDDQIATLQAQLLALQKTVDEQLAAKAEPGKQQGKKAA